MFNVPEAARPSNKFADLMRVFSALDADWKILSPVRAVDGHDTYGGSIMNRFLKKGWS